MSHMIQGPSTPLRIKKIKIKKPNRLHFDGLMIVLSPRKGLIDTTLGLLNMFSKVKTLKT